MCFRKGFPTRSNYTNNYSEASIRIIKDILFQRNKAWNAIQMFHLLTETLEMYYQRRMMSVATNRLDHHFVSLRFTVAGVKAHTIPSDDIVPKDDPDVYSVVSQTDKNTTWTVDLQLGECTCPTGLQSQPCKHQLAAAMKYRRNSVKIIPKYSPQGRQYFAALEVGKITKPVSTAIFTKKLRKSNRVSFNQSELGR